MEKNTKNGLIAVGSTLGLLAIIYFLFMKKKPKQSNNVFLPTPPKNEQNPLDPYFVVSKEAKINAIKDHLTKNNAMWLFADSYAKTNDNAINAWYAAIQKSEPTYTYYDKIFLTNRTINTNTGEKK